jgi:hypothetical protein
METTYPTPSVNTPYKLTYDEVTDRIDFIPQTEADRMETKKLSDRLNAVIKDTTSESAIAAKTFSDNLRAEIEKRFNSKNC